MVKKGPLSLVEKAAIQGLLSQQKSIEEISNTLDRSETSVENYINKELDELHTTIVNAQIESSNNEPDRYSKANKKKDLFVIKDIDTIDHQDVTDEITINKVMKRLKQAGLRENDIHKVIKLAISKYANIEKQFKDENELYTMCIKQMRAGEFMIKKAQGGTEGVAIMTPAASQRTDDSHRKSPSTSRSVRNNVFKPHG